MAEKHQPVVLAVIEILKDISLSDIVESTCKRLVSFGLEPVENDAYLIAFSIQKSAAHVLTATNQSKVPSGLFNVVVDMSCGEILDSLHKTGQLSFNNLCFDGIVSSIKEGDTQVSFDKAGSDEEKINVLIKNLIYGRERDLICFRKLRW